MEGFYYFILLIDVLNVIGQPQYLYFVRDCPYVNLLDKKSLDDNYLRIIKYSLSHKYSQLYQYLLIKTIPEEHVTDNETALSLATLHGDEKLFNILSRSDVDLTKSRLTLEDYKTLFETEAVKSITSQIKYHPIVSNELEYLLKNAVIGGNPNIFGRLLDTPQMQSYLAQETNDDLLVEIVVLIFMTDNVDIFKVLYSRYHKEILSIDGWGATLYRRVNSTKIFTYVIHHQIVSCEYMIDMFAIDPAIYSPTLMNILETSSHCTEKDQRLLKFYQNVYTGNLDEVAKEILQRNTIEARRAMWIAMDNKNTLMIKLILTNLNLDSDTITYAYIYFCGNKWDI